MIFGLIIGLTCLAVGFSIAGWYFVAGWCGFGLMVVAWLALFIHEEEI